MWSLSQIALKLTELWQFLWGKRILAFLLLHPVLFGTFFWEGVSFPYIKLCSGSFLPLSDSCGYADAVPSVAILWEPSESTPSPHSHRVNIIAENKNLNLDFVVRSSGSPLWPTEVDLPPIWYVKTPPSITVMTIIHHPTHISRYSLALSTRSPYLFWGLGEEGQ